MWSLSAQDSEILGYPVATLSGDGWWMNASTLSEYEAWRDIHGIQMASVRVDLPNTEEANTLERIGFRFIEVVIQPSISTVGRGWSSGSVEIVTPSPSNTRELFRIAETAFTSDRFSLDHRLPIWASGKRYRAWVETALNGCGYEVHQIALKGRVAGFFVTEPVADYGSHWHLTAIAPELHGNGVGRAAWNAMLAMEAGRGRLWVKTRISTANTPALNLYSSMGFRFSNPQATFHWVRGG